MGNLDLIVQILVLKVNQVEFCWGGAYVWNVSDKNWQCFLPFLFSQVLDGLLAQCGTVENCEQGKRLTKLTQKQGIQMITICAKLELHLVSGIC